MNKHIKYEQTHKEHIHDEQIHEEHITKLTHTWWTH